MNALQGQVGGDHYRKMGMQPFQFTMANRYDPLAHTVNKYVARHESKHGKVDLEKARHCVLLRLELIREYGFTYCQQVIPVTEYISVNGIQAEEANILLNLHHWVSDPADYPIHRTRTVTDEAVAAFLVQRIDALIAYKYPELGTEE